ncbi:TRAF3-interacting JNK-activating modulator isoform X2 [Mugil cephalus]|uniref:TRAF3-interacting JNK-activating modulator isoform X2 n=1 Tax=Mugil cephalus TaxID=48193 RepID=UPI001FB6270F|nr:TRAF3-interacting JNK-activating modulator isoform X2 [Mugil cephalus]
MDILDYRGILLKPENEFDRLVEIRAQKREYLRGRNNVTSCRSPPRDLDTRQIKNELKEKRQQEFLRRRSVSPEPCGPKSSRKRSPKTFSQHYSASIKFDKLYTNTRNTTSANGRPGMILTPNTSATEDPTTSSKWASLLSEKLTWMREERDHTKKQASASTPVIKETSQHRLETTYKNNSGQKTSIRTGKVQQKSPLQKEAIIPKKIMIEATAQTESGLVTIKESDIQRLADYLQEALWREEAAKKKLAALQKSMSDLQNSSNKIWTSRCSEDLLTNKIKSLEAQLQVCLQKFPKDGVKKLVVQMEKQRLVYEEKALVALQKATQDKTEALNKAETLQEALITSKAEALRWQSLYEELKQSAIQLRENQHLSNEQLQQLHSQVELSRAREDELREEVVSLRQERQDLQYNICLLQEDNQTLRQEMEHLRDGGDEVQDFMKQDFMMSEEADLRPTPQRESQLEELLRQVQDKLQLKETECEELQTELHAIEQECQSSQARLSQCREELRQLSHHRRRTTPCRSWWRAFVFFLLLLAVAGVAMLWSWHPPFREQVEDLYSDIETRIEDYLMEMASPQNSGCFRPI